ncbi:uncharacterized protein LOC117341722 [Pecten maximus]|uniref:uncharacterized protein LOC117341722 n=1 Tax=Pecten maximus TaxID=6579 RepID=UPI0014582859|nr:uncharacterized protein LOC117341722 [Pecten maximus]
MNFFYCVYITDPPLAKSWREDEARALLLHRISMDGEFRSMKTHKSLWKQISTMLKEQNITATPDQCDNKFKAMKKDYKSAKDHNNKSGNGTKTCRFFEEFDQLYGCRAGTTPEATLCSLSVDDTSTSTPQRKKTRKRPAASSASVLEQIEKRQEERMKVLKSMHDDKVKLLERFLKVLEKPDLS